MDGQDPLAGVVSRAQRIAEQGRRPVVVAIDGVGGAGKSTVAAALGARLGAAVIDGDDFYRGGMEWHALPPRERAARALDWEAQLRVLGDLRAGRPASWPAYDWDRDDGSHRSEPMLVGGDTPVVLLEGTFCARPELHPVLDLKVLLLVPPEVQRRRLVEREGDEEWLLWSATWSAAEAYYFEDVMPPPRFDLVLDDAAVRGSLRR